MNPRLNITDEQLAAWCRKWQITEVWLFGSVLRDDFSDGSDIDVMIRFRESAGWTLIDFAKMRIELEELVGRRIDLFTRKGVEGMKNPYRRNSILESAKVLYAA